MKSQPASWSAVKVQAGPSQPNHLGRTLALLGLLVLAGGLFSGCARMQQYSLESWQGPLPMHDLHYVQNDP